MAIKNAFVSRKPLATLPDMSLAQTLLYDCHPPIITEKNDTSNAPLDNYPHEIVNTK